jgi:A/G-specific adenine glycosylase
MSMVSVKKLNNLKRFSKILLAWNEKKNNRRMPWKGEKDPYKIWLSEIILQQTRVEQGLKYYERFIRAFPTIHHLAQAQDDRVFKLWEGLGYYNRCRNLIHTARYVSKDLKGKFPATYEELKALKGVGPYTAAAIASFAYQLPYAVVDGNVLRVLARIFGIKQPVDSTEGKKTLSRLAGILLNKNKPDEYNQAIMDFGAAVCKPAAPLCDCCPFRKSCFALKNNMVSSLPVKGKKPAHRTRWFNYLFIERKANVLVHQRNGKDIWRHLFEFPVIETRSASTPKTVLREAEKNNLLEKNKFEIVSVSELIRQQLSHQIVRARFLHIRLKEKPVQPPNFKWVNKKHLSHLAFPKIINDYLARQTLLKKQD